MGNQASRHLFYHSMLLPNMCLRWRCMAAEVLMNHHVYKREEKVLIEGGIVSQEKRPFQGRTWLELACAGLLSAKRWRLLGGPHPECEGAVESCVTRRDGDVSSCAVCSGLATV